MPLEPRGSRDHPSDYCGTENTAGHCSGARRSPQGNASQNECKSGHEDGPETDAGTSQGSFFDALAAFVLRFSEFDDQNRVLGSQANEHDEADLSVDIVFAKLRGQRKR